MEVQWLEDGKRKRGRLITVETVKGKLVAHVLCGDSRIHTIDADRIGAY